ncbi:MAG: hypothetical protein U1E99_08845 [Agitococcus sp.]
MLKTTITQSHKRLHLFSLDSTTVYIGHSQINNSSPWPMGVPRLHFP